MSILDLLFKKKKNNEIIQNNYNKLSISNNVIAYKNESLNDNDINKFYIHPDIKDLLWIGDGEKRNYFVENNSNTFECNGFKIHFSSITDEEPSLIYSNLPIGDVENIYEVEQPPYYPRYSDLTPEQRGAYWKLLENPYDSKINIGFVFILYYGLERHLLTRDYEKAFEEILRLRNVHTNRSFQSYSANALILTSICRKRPDLLIKFIESLDKEFEMNFSLNLLLLCKFLLYIPITSKEIIKLASLVGFTKLNYIKNYYEMFEQELDKIIYEKYSTHELLITDFVSDINQLATQSIPIFANISIREKNIDIPLLVENPEFKNVIYNILEITHNNLKERLALSRKNGEVLIKENKNINKKVELFDAIREKELLNELEKSSNNYFQRHFVLINIQEFYYKYRALDEKYLNKTIEYCIKDINSLEQVQQDYYKEEIKQIEKYTLDSQELQKEISKIRAFKGNIPAFKRLVIIYEKQKQYEKAIAICNQASKYYKGLNMKIEQKEFDDRKQKISNK